MRRMTWAAVMVIALAGAGMGAGRPGDQTEPTTGGCSEATLRGAYGLQFQGTRPVRPPFPPGIESYSGVAIRTYDGQGQFTQTSNVKGSVIGVEADVESAGTYLVNADCSGSHAAQFVPDAPPIVDSFVIVSNGSEIRFIVMTPLPVMNSGVLQRIRGQ